MIGNTFEPPINADKRRSNEMFFAGVQRPSSAADRTFSVDAERNTSVVILAIGGRQMTGVCARRGADTLGVPRTVAAGSKRVGPTTGRRLQGTSGAPEMRERREEQGTVRGGNVSGGRNQERRQECRRCRLKSAPCRPAAVSVRCREASGKSRRRRQECLRHVPLENLRPGGETAFATGIPL